MTTPNDPWSVRPSEQFGQVQGGDQQYHTADPYQAYGAPGEPTQGYPTYQAYDPNRPPPAPGQPNPTQVLPTYPGYPAGQQYPGGQPYPGQQYPPAGPDGPGGYGEVPPLGTDPGPPRKRGSGTKIAIGAVVLLLLAGLGALILVFRGGSDDSSAAAASTAATTARPLPSGRSQSSTTPALPSIQLPSGLTLPSQIPEIGDALGGMAVGTITANDGSTITIQAVGGGVTTVHTDGSTQVISLTGSKVSDLKVNDSILVQGEKQGDGSILAKNIIGTGLPHGFGN